MNLSQNPHVLCLRLEVPPAKACALIAQPDEVNSRHAVEKTMQAIFYDAGVDAYVHEGVGSFHAGHIFILTDAPAATLRELKAALQTFVIEGLPVNLLPFVHIGWQDKSDNRNGAHSTRSPRARSGRTLTPIPSAR